MTRELVEQAFGVDARELVRLARRHGGTTTGTVSRGSSAVAFAADLGARGFVLVGTCDGAPFRQAVRLAEQAMHLGGGRLWAVCPSCVRRCAWLYIGTGGAWACRSCSGLVYASTRERGLSRAVSRASKVRARLGGLSGIVWPFPARPRGMRRRTYARWRARGLVLEDRALGAVEAWADRFDARHGRRARHV